MSVLLLPISWISVCLLLRRAARRFGASDDVRYVLLFSSLLHAGILTLATELLSSINAIHTFSIVLLWSVTAFGAAAGAMLLGAKPHGAHPPRQPLAREERVYAGALVAISSIVLVIALVAPPNTGDSQTYHLPRVMHWIQNGNIRFYPTAVPRQLYLAPGAEYHILHLQLLARGDRYAASVQWLSMLGSLVAVSLIGQMLGLDRRGQLLSALVAASLPMGILQASSTQNDYVLGFWLLCFIAFGIRLAQAPGLVSALAAGLALGLACLAKPTAYLYALPFSLLFGVRILARQGRRAWRPAIVVVAAVALLNAGHWWRNCETFGNPAGTGEHQVVELRNEWYGVRPTLSNVLRNIGLHAVTPSERFNDIIERGIRFAHKLLHVDIQEARTTFYATRYETVPLSTHEDRAANPLHLVLLGAAALATLAWPATLGIRRQQTGWYLLCLVAGLVLFCGLLKWQPWHSRLHLPLFLVGTPLIAVLLRRLPGPRTRLPAAGILVLCGLPALLRNEVRPVLGEETIFNAPRIEQYTGRGRAFPERWKELARFIGQRGYPEIGLILHTGDRCEYLLWTHLWYEQGRRVRIWHVNVINPTASVKHNRRPPGCRLPAVASLVWRPRPQPERITVDTATYVKIWSSPNACVYEPESPSHTPPHR